MVQVYMSYTFNYSSVRINVNLLHLPLKKNELDKPFGPLYIFCGTRLYILINIWVWWPNDTDTVYVTVN